MKQGKHRLMTIFLGLILAAGIVLTALSFIGRVYWIFELLVHFKEYFAISFLILALVSLYLKLRTFFIVAIIFFILHSIPFIPFYSPVKKPKTHGETVSLMMANVKRTNTQYPRVISYIQSIDPDIVILEETDERWTGSIEALRKTYPYGLQELRNDYFGIILLSKIPLEDAQVVHLGRAMKPSVIATIVTDDGKMTIIGTHPVPPFTKRNAQLRDDQLEQIAQLVKKQTLPTILIGDLNTTPFSTTYHTLLKETNLTDCAHGFGYQRTWHYAPFIPPLRLSLDHCLRSDEISIYESYVGADIGSDHLPILEKFSLNGTE